MPYPVASSRTIEMPTQRKKVFSTSTHKSRRSGASSTRTVAGRKTTAAKNIPPTQTMAAIRWITIASVTAISPSQRRQYSRRTATGNLRAFFHGKVFDCAVVDNHRVAA